MTLDSKDQQRLLELARQTVTTVIRQEEPLTVDLHELSEDLRSDGASFVTITRDGALRGCIGTLEARRPLAEDVQENALAAAFHDPRFPPISQTELRELRFEVSVLSAPQPLDHTDPSDLIAQLRPGIDGVVIESGFRRATFLPQVWEKIPDPHLFLQQLCLKAGLSHDCWAEGSLKVYTYQVQKFAED